MVLFCRQRHFRLFFALLLVAAGRAGAAGPTGLLNDTGQTLCYDGSAMVACTAANTGDGASFPRQDGRFGRDRAGMAKIGGGAAGFDFTKICMNGDAAGAGSCPSNPTANTGATPAPNEWACTRDNVTNLIWSLETINSITWTDATSTAVGSPIALANAASRCGYNNNWRVPTQRELYGLVHHGKATTLTIDLAYFPDMAGGRWYWTSNSNAADSSRAWCVYFDNGGSNNTHPKTESNYVRLVVSGN